MESNNQPMERFGAYLGLESLVIGQRIAGCQPASQDLDSDLVASLRIESIPQKRGQEVPMDGRARIEVVDRKKAS
jgi:hypothetical protein